MAATKTQTIPVKERNKEYYQLEFTHGLPPGTDSIEQFEKNPRLPRPPATPKRPLPELPPISERKGKWVAKYLNQLDSETEYDQIIRVYNFYQGSDFNTALGYAAVFIWLTSTPAGATAVHGGKVINRGHQRYYETQEINLNWVHWGSGSEETKGYVEKINKVHAGVWKRVPGAFSHPWEAQAAIILLSWYEEYIRRSVGAKNGIYPQLRKAWPQWGERVTGWFKSEPSDGSRSFGINYPRDWDELERYVQWYIDFDFDEQMTEESKVKGHETAEAFIHQFSELWFPRYFHFLGRAVVLTFVPKNIRRKQRLENPNPVLEYLIKLGFRLFINFGDSQPDSPTPSMEEFFQDLQAWDLNKIDRVETAKRDAQTRLFNRSLWAAIMLIIGFMVYSRF